MMKRIVSTMTIAALLAGCSTPAAPPVSFPDVSFDQSENSTNTTFIPTGSQVSLGLLYSKVTKDNQTYLRRYQANAGTGFGQSLLVQSIHDAYVATSNPDLAVDWVKASLQHQFGSVTVYPDMQSLKAANPEIIVILDTYSRLITSRSSDIESTVGAHIYDQNFKYIGTAKGKDTKILTPLWAGNKRSEEIIAETAEQQSMQIKALETFDQSLSDLLYGETR